MALIQRILLLVTWAICLALYMLVIAGVMNPIDEFVHQMDVVVESPFYAPYEWILWIGTYAVPVMLILGPIVYWFVSNVREEAQQFHVPPRI